MYPELALTLAASGSLAVSLADKAGQVVCEARRQMFSPAGTGGGQQQPATAGCQPPDAVVKMQAFNLRLSVQ